MRYDLVIAPIEWSYSRLTAYEDCPYAWLQKYVFGVEGESKFFAEYGSFMHSILQLYLTGKLKKEQLTTYYLTHFLSQVSAKAPTSKIHSSYFEQGRQYLKVLSFPQRNILQVEDKMKFNFAGYPFVGIVDVVSEDENGKLYITDHKSRALKERSNRKKPTQSDIELDKYLRQLYIYAYAVEKSIGRFPDYLEFNCFRTQTWICEPFQYERLIEVEAWAKQLIETIIQTARWPANLDLWFCKYLCDCSGECEYTSLLETR